MSHKVSIALLSILLSANAVAKDYEKHSALMDHGDGHLMDMNGGMVGLPT